VIKYLTIGLFLSLSLNTCYAQDIVLLQKQIEIHFNSISQSNSAFHWQFQSLKAFPITKYQSTRLSCCPEERNYVWESGCTNSFYLISSSEVIAGLKYYYTGNQGSINKYCYIAYDFVFNQDQGVWQKKEGAAEYREDVITNETDQYNDLP
jgi:hypothetical protein